VTTLWAAIVVLGVLVFVHELGHFLAARACGVEVRRFSLGFGPRLAGFRRGATDYRISAVPLGGYVKMLGEALDDEIEPEKTSVSFAHKPPGQRLIIVAAGPLANFVLAVILFGLITLVYGTPMLLPQVGKVLDGYPAQTAGLRPGDTVLSVGDKEVSSWEDMAGLIAANGSKPLNLAIKRGKDILTVTITPIKGQARDPFGQLVARPMIGISPSGQTFVRRVSPIGAFVDGLAETWQVTRLTFLTIVKLIQGQIPFKTVGGPIFIAQAAGQQAKAGAVSLLFFMGLLSVNLGLLNLLPIPVFDGGHLVFFTIEMIIRRPVSMRIRERAQQAGLAFILIFMALVFYNDIARILSSSAGSG